MESFVYKNSESTSSVANAFPWKIVMFWEEHARDLVGLKYLETHWQLLPGLNKKRNLQKKKKED